MWNVRLLLRGADNADCVCPVMLPFPLLALHAGQEVRNSGRLRAGNAKEVYRLFLKKKPKDARSVCAHVGVCVFNLLFNFPRRKKKALFCLVCWNHPLPLSKHIHFWTSPLCISLRLSPLIIYIWCSSIRLGFSLPKKVIIAFDLFSSSKLMLFVIVTE